MAAESCKSGRIGFRGPEVSPVGVLFLATFGFEIRLAL